MMTPILCFFAAGSTAFRPGVKREERGYATGRGIESLGRAIHDFPVAQVAAPAERHRTGADAAERQGDAPKMLLVVPGENGPGLVGMSHGASSLIHAKAGKYGFGVLEGKQIMAAPASISLKRA